MRLKSPPRAMVYNPETGQGEHLPGDEWIEGKERFHGAAIVSERACRDESVALGITQLLTDPEMYHVVWPSKLISMCECPSPYELGLEFQTSAGQFDEVVLWGGRGIITYWNGQEIGSLAIAHQSQRDRLLSVAAGLLSAESEQGG